MEQAESRPRVGGHHDEVVAAKMTQVLTNDSQKLLYQLNTLLEQKSRCQQKVCSLKLIESAHDNSLRMTARLRDFEVKDLLSLTQFFGFDTETFSLAVNFLDRFLCKMKVQAKHLGCVGLNCFYLAVKSIEEERNVPLATDLIRISQYRFTVSDLMRMEKIVLEKKSKLLLPFDSCSSITHSFKRPCHLKGETI